LIRPGNQSKTGRQDAQKQPVKSIASPICPVFWSWQT
jgi:hypothetical protein